MEILGYIALTVMGLVLSLVGAGGSVLTIPILVYLLNLPILLATSYSLVIVGSTAFIATLRYYNYIIFKNALLLMLPSILGVFLSRRFLIVNLPAYFGSVAIEYFLLILLLVFMVVSGVFMIQKIDFVANDNINKINNIKIVPIGLILGILIGLLGTGGGFLIVPTLVLLLGLNMQQAVSSSLFIITINSLVGFLADKHHFIASDWLVLLQCLVASFVGLLLGFYMSKFFNGNNLKKLFGYFVWAVAAGIVLKSFVF
jgi:uncharacterized membrane protein YfcA